MMGHKISFYGQIWLIFPKLSVTPLICTTVSCSARCRLRTSSANNVFFLDLQSSHEFSWIFISWVSGNLWAVRMVPLFHQKSVLNVNIQGIFMDNLVAETTVNCRAPQGFSFGQIWGR